VSQVGDEVDILLARPSQIQNGETRLPAEISKKLLQTPARPRRHHLGVKEFGS
jgi:hypothetical protein